MRLLFIIEGTEELVLDIEQDVIPNKGDIVGIDNRFFVVDRRGFNYTSKKVISPILDGTVVVLKEENVSS